MQSGRGTSDTRARAPAADEDARRHDADAGREALVGPAGAALAESARRGRVADHELAVALRRPVPAGAAASARYRDELGRRPALPQSRERELVVAAQSGDQTARARLVEAFLPLIASVARLYRESPQIERIELLQEGVVGLLRALERVPRSTDEPVAAEDGAVGTFGELLLDPLAEGEYERVLDAIEAQELLALLAGLSEREREVLRARYGVADGEEQSLRTVAATMGLSGERVRQLEQRALGKLAAAAATDSSQGG